MMVVLMEKKAEKQSSHDEDVPYTLWNVAYAQATTNPQGGTILQNWMDGWLNCSEMEHT